MCDVGRIHFRKTMQHLSSPGFKNQTDQAIRDLGDQNRLDPTEMKVLQAQDAGIRGRVEWDKQTGHDPVGDPILAGMQANNRRTALQFGDYNP